MRTLFKNSTIVNADISEKADILIEDGRIIALGNELEAIADETVDCSNKFILPGFVDMHFHCRVPGNTEREDFDTATMAAAHAGVTTLAEMPISKPSPCNKKRFIDRIEYAKDRAVIDFAFYGAGGNIDEKTAMELAESGAIGFKIFLHNMPVGREDEFENLCITGTENLFYSIKNNSKTGLITAIHCEDDGILKAVRNVYEGDKFSYKSQLDCRIETAEELAIITAGLVAKEAKGKLHICHVASKAGVEAVEYLQNQGVDITAETCPPYIMMNKNIIQKYGGSAKINPPVRDEIQQDKLIEALKKGTIMAVASDHAPFLHFEKDREDVEFLDLPAGMPSVEMFGPSMIDKAFEGQWSLNQLVSWMSINPAKLLGLDDKKGSIKIGKDADFIIVDPHQNTIIDVNKLFTKSKLSCFPFEGKEYKGKIIATYVRGEKVYSEDKIWVKKGYGKFMTGKGYKSISKN